MEAYVISDFFLSIVRGKNKYGSVQATTTVQLSLRQIEFGIEITRTLKQFVETKAVKTTFLSGSRIK